MKMKPITPIQIWDRPDGLAVLGLASEQKRGCYFKACIFRPVVVEVLDPDFWEFRFACWDHLAWAPKQIIRVSGLMELHKILTEVRLKQDVEV